jgi:putative ABC transport system substrate-binding protein
LLTATGALLAAPLTVGAQPAKIARVGFLSLDLAGNPRGTDSFKQGLHELGYVEGRNIHIELRSAERRFERFPALVAELVALNVDVIVAPNVVAAQAAKQATKTIPIVFAGVADPITDGLVISLARPGGNATGLSNLSPDLVGKRLQLLVQATPGIRRVAVLWQPGSGMEQTDKDTLKDARAAAQTLGVALEVYEARVPADLDGAFAAMAREGVNALSVLGTPMFFTERERIVALAIRNRLPAMFSTRQFVVAGGLMSYGASLDDLLRRSAGYVDKLLKGAKPAELPVEQPTKFELIINLKTARTLGLTVSPAVLARADEVIR